jgi:hypothetical protein
VKTEQDRKNAMDPGSLDFATSEPRIQLYFMLGHVYAPVTPLLLPFIVVFFAFSYMVYRHQVSSVIVCFFLLRYALIITYNKCISNQEKK